MVDVIFDVVDGVASITLNRPRARNAINGAVAQRISDILDEVHARDDISVAVITGAEGNFCAGMDLKAFLASEQVRLPGAGFAGVTEQVLKKPLIAAVEGYALAGGFEIALSCHIIVAASNSRFGLPELKRGLVPNAGGMLRLPRQLPSKIAAELVLTGDLVSCEKLAAYGLINHVVEPGEAFAKACEVATTISRNGPLALAAAIAVLRDSADWPQGEMFKRQDELTRHVFNSEDAREGARAFSEKRLPIWRGM